MRKITLEITGLVALGGHPPGSSFLVDAFDDGTPADAYWRRRLADEAQSGCGAVRVKPDDSADDTPPPTAPTVSKKGR